jgi:hypothetical protein
MKVIAFELGKKTNFAACSTSDGGNGVVANQREVGGAFE